MNPSLFWMYNAAKKIMTRCLLVYMIFALVCITSLGVPQVVSAETDAPPCDRDASGNCITSQTTNAGAIKQAGTYGNTTQSTTAGSAKGAAGSLGSCIAGEILAAVFASTAGQAVIKGLTKKTTTSTASGAQTQNYVPVAETGQVLKNNNLATFAEYGDVDSTTGLPTTASLNSVAWCLINAMVSYIVDATIAWVQGGFNGNPAYVDNPGEFFKAIGDLEAGSFIQTIAGSTGVNICAPFRAQVVLGLRQGYGNTAAQYARRSTCTLTQVVSNVKQFTQGNFQAGGWPGWLAISQNDANNPYGAYLMNNDELYARVGVKNNTAQLQIGWNNGFLSSQTCEKQGDPRSCKTTTPGSIIQSSLEKTLGIPKDRLVIAQKFDQLVTVLVTELIKVALDKALSSGSEQ